MSVQAASGDIRAALGGYGELIDYWERTGAWTQQWTTLRNLADLLDQLDDHDCASLLRRAADEAPEAASTAVVSAIDVLERDEVDAPALSPSLARSRALDTARQAIARQLAIVAEGCTRVTPPRLGWPAGHDQADRHPPALLPGPAGHRR